MGTGVIFAVLAVLWAVVLIPMWLRRHETTNEVRQVSRWQGTMRRLGGPSVATAATAPGSPAMSSPATAAPRGVRPVAPRPAVAPRGAARPLSARARRRRLALVGAAVLVVAALVAAVAGWVPDWVVLALVGVVVLAVVGSALLAQRRKGREADRRRAAARAARRQRLDRIDRSASSGVRPVHGAPPVPAAGPASGPVGGSAPYDADADDGWEPVAVPLPTYVTAPKAPRAVRVIDLTRPGRWVDGEAAPAPGSADTAPAGPASTPRVRTEFLPSDGASIVTGEVVVERLAANG